MSNPGYEVPVMGTVKEVASWSGLSEYYIRKLCWEKKIVFVRAGTKYLINYTKFIDFLNKGDTDVI